MIELIECKAIGVGIVRFSPLDAHGVVSDGWLMPGKADTEIEALTFMKEAIDEGRPDRMAQYLGEWAAFRLAALAPAPAPAVKPLPGVAAAPAK